MYTKTVNIYKFEELSDDAKEVARAWFREGSDSFEWESENIIEDAQQIGALMGIEFYTHSVPLMNGSTRGKPTVLYDLGNGGGVGLEASYRYQKGAVKAVKDYAGVDTELHRIATELQKAQKKRFYKLQATLRSIHRDTATGIEVEHADHNWRELGQEASDLEEALQDFVNWIYKQLQAAEEYVNSNEYCDEGIICNEYTFTEDGERED